MRVFRSVDAFAGVAKPVVTTGTFDGVHCGHRTIIDRINAVAQRTGGESVILTFHPHPRTVLFPDDHGLRLLSTLDERLQLLDEAGAQNVVVQQFTREFSRITSLDFVRGILVDKLQTKVLVIGHDHHFGRNREGSFAHLVEYGPMYGFQVEEIPAHDVDAVTVSSTKIRNALAEGDVAAATRYLARPYSISGTVIAGDQIGRTIGFPTANLGHIDPFKAIPANGVYAATANLGEEKFRALVNIGSRPTVGGVETRIEAHLLDFDRDIYNQQIALHFYQRIREERHFANIEALKTQIEIDRKTLLP